MKNKLCIVITTTDKEDIAKKIAQNLVVKKLAACVQTYKVNSTYVWKEEVQDSEEFRLEAKTVENNYEAIKALILADHNYDLPEIIKIDITGGSDEYMDWVASCCKE